MKPSCSDGTTHDRPSSHTSALWHDFFLVLAGHAAVLSCGVLVWVRRMAHLHTWLLISVSSFLPSLQDMKLSFDMTCSSGGGGSYLLIVPRGAGKGSAALFISRSRVSSSRALTHRRFYGIEVCLNHFDPFQARLDSMALRCASNGSAALFVCGRGDLDTASAPDKH